MSIFGIGGWELILVLVIMLIVAGPKRMAQWAYVLGQYAAKLRVMWEEVMGSLQQELDDAGVGIQLPKSPPTREGLRASIRDVGRQIMESDDIKELKEAGEELTRTGKVLQEDVSRVERQVKASANELNRAVSSDGVNAGKKENGMNGTIPKAADDEDHFGTWGGKSE